MNWDHEGQSFIIALDKKTGKDIWKVDRDEKTSWATPLVVDNKLYFLRSNNGILSCFDAKNGKEYYSRQRLEGMGNVFASPVGVKDRVYVVGQKGTMYVIKHGPVFEVLAKNKLDDNFSASPAIVGSTLYLRGYKNFYCIEEKN